MSDILSIKTTDVDLSTNKSDYFALLIKRFGNLATVLSAAGLVGPEAPVVVSTLAEIIAFKIPEQKLDRVIRFLRIVAERVEHLEDEFAKERIKSEQFADLIEDGMQQASRALSDERREYIANLLKNSLTHEDLDHVGKKKLLSLLGELLDPEIVLLYYYSLQGKNREKVFEFQDRYPFIKKVIYEVSDRQPEVQEEILFSSYRGKLVMSNLVMGTGGISERASALGELLISYIEPKI